MRDAPSRLLQFVGGHVVIEGVEFELECGAGRDGLRHRERGYRADLRGCSFRRPDRTAAERPGHRGRPGPGLRGRASAGRRGRRPSSPITAISTAARPPSGPRARPTSRSRDCTLGPAVPSIWFDNTPAERSTAGELRLIHTSILAGPGPVFRFDGGPVRARVDDCVIAAAGREPAALVQVEDPRNLGCAAARTSTVRSAPFLRRRPARPSRHRPRITRRGSSTSPRNRDELGSQASELPVWDAADPLLALTQERVNPTRVFLLGPKVAATSDIGARQGPFGSILKNVRMAQPPPHRVPRNWP